MNSLKKILVTSASLAGLAAFSTAQATPISYTDIVSGTSMYTSGGVVVKALKNGSASTFGIKCNGGSDANHCGFGVNGGDAGAEIDAMESDSILFDYSSLGGVRIDSFKLALLYNGPEFGDAFELGLVRVNGLNSYTISLNGENSASWSGLGGVVTNCSPTTQNEGGCFNVSNPFGDLMVTSLQFYAANNYNGNNSDYVVSAVDAPEPMTLSLLGLGVAGLLVGARRRKAA